jgi:hypothetical protein
MFVCEWSSYHVKPETEENMDLLPHMKKGFKHYKSGFLYACLCTYMDLFFRSGWTGSDEQFFPVHFTQCAKGHSALLSVINSSFLFDHY